MISTISTLFACNQFHAIKKYLPSPMELPAAKNGSVVAMHVRNITAFLGLLAALAVMSLAPASAAAAYLATWDFESRHGGWHSNHIAANGGLHAGSSYASLSHGLDRASSKPGNGSKHSLGAEDWSVGDYFQFTVSTSGYEDIVISWEQARSWAVGSNFALQYSLTGVCGNFTTALTYCVLGNVDDWNRNCADPDNQFSFDLSSITGLNDNPNVVFRLVSLGGSPGCGDDLVRIDNFSVQGSLESSESPPCLASPVPAPPSAALALSAIVVGVGFRIRSAWRQRRFG